MLSEMKYALLTKLRNPSIIFWPFVFPIALATLMYFAIGRNKLAPDYEKAVWRARNVAAPQRASQLGRKTPCAVKKDRCYDCKSPERICRGMTTLWGPMTGMEAEVLLIDADLGL